MLHSSRLLVFLFFSTFNFIMFSVKVEKIQSSPFEVIAACLVKFCNENQMLEATILFNTYHFTQEQIIQLFEIGTAQNNLYLLEFLLTTSSKNFCEHLFNFISWTGVSKEATQLFLRYGVKIRKEHEEKFVREHQSIQKLSANFALIKDFLHLGTSTHEDDVDDFSKGGNVMKIRKFIAYEPNHSVQSYTQGQEQQRVGILQSMVGRILRLTIP